MIKLLAIPSQKTYQLKKLKVEFTVKEIGVFRYYSGVVVGILGGFILNLLLRFCLRLANLGIFVEDWSFDYVITPYYYQVIAFNAVAFSFCFTTSLWMSGVRASHRNKTRRLRMASINAKWVVYTTLAVLAKMFLFIGNSGISLEKDFYFLGYLLPIFLFLYCWNLISDVYRVRKKVLFALVQAVIFGLILSLI